MNPQPFFSARMAYQNYEVWSDQPIPSEMTVVLDDVSRRLRTSEFYKREARYKIFICNAPWRIFIWGAHFSTGVGGFADIMITQNIYIRSSDIASNRVTLPGGVDISDAAVRPMSYLIAHEAAHIMEGREFGRLAVVRHPQWLIEGYADYVGKGGQFDFEENRALLARGDKAMDFSRSGLYRSFHLQVAYWMDKKMLTARQLFEATPSGDGVLSSLKATP